MTPPNSSSSKYVARKPVAAWTLGAQWEPSGSPVCGLMNQTLLCWSAFLCKQSQPGHRGTLWLLFLSTLQCFVINNRDIKPTLIEHCSSIMVQLLLFFDLRSAEELGAPKIEPQIIEMWVDVSLSKVSLNQVMRRRQGHICCWATAYTAEWTEL